MRVHVKCAKSGIGSPLKLLLKKMEALPNVRLITWNNNSLSPAKAAAATCEHKHVEFFRDSGDSNKGVLDVTRQLQRRSILIEWTKNCVGCIVWEGMTSRFPKTP